MCIAFHVFVEIVPIKDLHYAKSEFIKRLFTAIYQIPICLAC